MSKVASLSTSLNSVGKLVRLLEKEGVTADQILRAINDLPARKNLVNFLKTDCPQFEEDRDYNISHFVEALAKNGNLMTTGGVSLNDMEYLVAKEVELGTHLQDDQVIAILLEYGRSLNRYRLVSSA